MNGLDIAAAGAKRVFTHTGPDAARLVVADAMRDGLSPSVQQMLREIDQHYFDPLTLEVLAARIKKDARTWDGGSGSSSASACTITWCRSDSTTRRQRSGEV